MSRPTASMRLCAIHKEHFLWRSVLYARGFDAIDDRTITQQLGHTDISTTHDFYHRSRLKAKERSEILDGIAEIRASQKTS